MDPYGYVPFDPTGGGYGLPQMRRPPSPVPMSFRGGVSPQAAGPQQKRTSKVLQLPPPQRNKRNYDIPLPNDCEGLIYALEGKFNCGEEIVSDAATRILRAVTERRAQLLEAGSSGCESFKSLVSSVPHRLSSSQKASKLRVLESSWVTSAYLPNIALNVLEARLTEVEVLLSQFWCTGERTWLEGQGGGPALLQALDAKRLTFETLTTLSELLQTWVYIRWICGVFEKPKVPEEALNVVPKERRKKLPSVIVANPPPPQPRGVGRPRLVPVLSMGDFVDTLQDSLDLSLMKPAATPTIFYRLVKATLRLTDVWLPLFIAAADEAERLAQLEESDDHTLTDPPAFPIHPDHALIPEPPAPQDSTDRMAREKASSTGGPSAVGGSAMAGSDVTGGEFPQGRGAEGPRSLVNDDGSSIFLTAEAWDKLAASVFVDSELRETFLESIKEAEFLVWRENRRMSNPSSTAMGVEVASNNGRLQLEQRLEREDLCCVHPVVGLGNVLVAALVRLASILLQVGAHEELRLKLISAFKHAWTTPLLTYQPEQYALGTHYLPALYKSTGLHFLNILLDFGRDHLSLGTRTFAAALQLSTTGTAASRMTTTGTATESGTATSDREFLETLCEIAADVMLLFGRFVTSELFPSVAPTDARMLDAMAPQCGGLPVEINSTKSAVVLTLIGMEELEGYPEHRAKRVWYGLLFCAFGAAVAIARQHGLVNAPSPPVVSGDEVVIKTLLECVPENVRDRAVQLIKQRGYQVDRSQPSPAFKEDDLDTILSDTIAPTLGPPVPKPTGPMDTYDQKVDETNLDVLEDILYACTTIFLGLVRENEKFAKFLSSHKKTLKKVHISVLHQILPPSMPPALPLYSNLQRPVVRVPTAHSISPLLSHIYSTLVLPYGLHYGILLNVRSPYYLGRRY
ncbi:hypothetical protein GNI_049760 [Gregarina niphandrodes]|uniref:Uncharacterized protein n=1 Tax=Gregarina niphandrodes TaxID=110365 RepID=A0A023B9J4_GRENI|nr:hypothetical protein GNI_049760 [Gregarina niphandrodes]EZG72999.1 hypothetical protein GNI_049760 [Gregarina niphandrodes]|eukprot:XP_011129694.1 hypothetical protein GNI_049760 [Gregarina niphandrodes]